MNRNFSLLFGGGLIMLGFFVLAANALTSILGISVSFWEAYRIWPMIIITIGLMFVAPPILAPHNRGLGYLFIPGMPILTTGGMLMFASLFEAWGIWSVWWPLIVLSFGVGFFLAGLFGRNIYLLIPGLFFFMNGLVLQFCALTNLWEAWAVLWAVEPFSIGLALLIIGIRNRSGLALAFAFTLCTIAVAAFFGMSALLFSGSWLFRYGASAVLILTGVLVLLTGLLGKPSRSGDGDADGKGEVLEEALA